LGRYCDFLASLGSQQERLIRSRIYISLVRCAALLIYLSTIYFIVLAWGGQLITPPLFFLEISRLPISFPQPSAFIFGHPISLYALHISKIYMRSTPVSVGEFAGEGPGRMVRPRKSLSSLRLG